MLFGSLESNIVFRAPTILALSYVYVLYAVLRSLALRWNGFLWWRGQFGPKEIRRSIRFKKKMLKVFWSRWKNCTAILLLSSSIVNPLHLMYFGNPLLWALTKQMLVVLSTKIRIFWVLGL